MYIGDSSIIQYRSRVLAFREFLTRFPCNRILRCIRIFVAYGSPYISLFISCSRTFSIILSIDARSFSNEHRPSNIFPSKIIVFFFSFFLPRINLIYSTLHVILLSRATIFNNRVTLNLYKLY